MWKRLIAWLSGTTLEAVSDAPRVRKIYNPMNPLGLEAYLREWREWAQNGAPEHKVFHHSYGLCSTFHQWLKSKAPKAQSRAEFLEREERKSELTIALGAWCDYMLNEDGNSRSHVYPFGGVDRFRDDLLNAQMHQNFERQHFVSWQIKRLTDAREVGTLHG